MKLNFFKSGYNEPLLIQSADNPANFDIDISSEYFGDALRVIPKKYRQDIKDFYITSASLNQSQIDKLKILSRLDYIRDGKFKGFNKI